MCGEKNIKEFLWKQSIRPTFKQGAEAVDLPSARRNSSLAGKDIDLIKYHQVPQVDAMLSVQKKKL